MANQILVTGEASYRIVATRPNHGHLIERLPWWQHRILLAGNRLRSWLRAVRRKEE